jgi:hypothetical protein
MAALLRFDPRMGLRLGLGFLGRALVVMEPRQELARRQPRGTHYRYREHLGIGWGALPLGCVPPVYEVGDPEAEDS